MTRILSVFGILLLSACDPTGGLEVPFSMRVETVRQGDAPPGTFTTSTGWSVSLDEAAVSIAAVYLWENPPPLARRTVPQRLWNLVVPQALAHPGDTHFSGGAVLGEHVGLFDYDLLSDGLELGERIGNEGGVRSFSVLLEPPASDDGPTRGHIAWVKGRATKGDAIVPFEGGLDLERTGRDRRVDGIPTEGDVTADSTFVLEVRLERWLRDAEFSSLTEEVVDGTKRITPTSQVRAAWFLGARSVDAFAARWETAR